MTIKNVIRVQNGVLSVAGGTVTTLTSSIADPPVHPFLPYIATHNACKRDTAWFEGRLFTGRTTTWGPGAGYTSCFFRRWDNDPVADTWEYQPDHTNAKGLQIVNTALPYSYPVPGLIAFKDNVYLFWDGTAARPTYTGSVSHTWGYMRWNPNPGPNGLTTVEAWQNPAVAGYYSNTYTKTAGSSNHGHILDIIEHSGNLYITTPMNLLSVQPPSGDVTLLDEPSTDWNDQVCRTLGLFKAGSGNTALYMLDGNGKVKMITALVSEVADLKLINANITNGSGALLGWMPTLVQVGATFYAFLNDTTGTVLFSSTDGTSWTEITGTLPAGWQTANSHIKCTIDPSGPEVRVMFVNVTSGAFDIYSFDGSSFTYLGSSASSTNMSFTFFDKDAADAELEGTVTVNAGLGTADIPFQLFREVSATGTIDVEAEYSLDGGTTWYAATGTPKVNLNASDSRPAGAGAAYTFVWNWQADLGPGLYSNVRFRIRSI